MRTLIFLPTYNERENIIPLLGKIFDICEDLEISADILVIDDNSPDGTADAVRKASEIYNKNIDLIVREGKLGLGTALKHAFNYSTENNYDIMVLMDADFQHPPETIPILVNMVREGYDLVIASRYISGGGIKKWSLVREVVSKGANYYAKLILNLPISDLTSGFRAFSKKAIEYLSNEYLSSKGYAFQVEVVYKLWRKGFRITEVPFIFGERRVGESKLSFKVIVEFFFNILRFRWYK